MVGGAVVHLAATTEPDMKLSLHPALQITGNTPPENQLLREAEQSSDEPAGYTYIYSND
jgi:hypothetical protein